MDVITGLAYGLSIMVFGSAGIVGFALYLAHRDAKEKRESIGEVR